MLQVTNYVTNKINMAGVQEDIFNNLIIHSINSEAFMI